MNIPMEDLQEMSAQERAVLYLTDALNQLIKYAKMEHLYVKVDMAFTTSKGLVIYSHNNGYEVNQYLVTPEGNPVFIYSPGKENPDGLELYPDATKDQITKIFKDAESQEGEEYPRTMLSEVEFVGRFDDDIRAYAVVVGFKNGIENKELFQSLFAALVRALHHKVTKERLEQLVSLDNELVAPSRIVKDAALRFLGKKFYGREIDHRRDELYETLCLLASAPYEKNQNRGRIGIATPTALKSKALVRFVNPIEIKKENVRVLRKLLELSDRQRNILIADDAKIIGVHSIKENNGRYQGTGVLFRGYGKWDLFSGKSGSLISFDSVTVSLANNQSLERMLKGAFNESGIMDYDEKKILNIVRQAKKQPHGTTIIVSECAVSEAERLVEANKAIQIEPIAAEDEVIVSLSSIDGAMIIGTDGVCHAIGAILDGATIKDGNIARGARYNSAITYVDYWKTQNEPRNAVAIIVSSDDTVDVYPNKDIQNAFLSVG